MSLDPLDFLNSNSLRAYPVKEGMSVTSGLFVLPTTFMVDMSISASAAVSDEFYISRIENYVDRIVVYISQVANSVVIGSFTVSPATHIQNAVYTLAPATTYARGRLCVGSLTDMLLQPQGAFDFAATVAKLEMRVSTPLVFGVTSMTFTDSDGFSQDYTGDVTILARTNLTFSESSEGVIRLDAGYGLGLNQACPDARIPIRTINGAKPDSNGNFQLRAGECINVTSATAVITVDNTCSKPCADCSDITQLTDMVRKLETDFISLRDFYNLLNNQFTSYTAATSRNCGCAT